MQKQWHLMRGDMLLGCLSGERVDQPFYFYNFEREPAFAEYEPLFSAELQSLNKGDTEQWMRDYQRIEDLALTLVAPDGSDTIREFILHVDGREAWLRAS
jgi:hypothetical protein